MKSRKLYALFVVFILAVWLVTPTLALAQDEIPPAETPVEVVTEEAPPEITVEEVQEQLPENTELVLLTGDGLEVPLGSTEGDVILASGDPVYCPCGAPLGDATCTPLPGWATLAQALGEAQADAVCSGGTIYVESTYVGASANGALVIDADNFVWGDWFSLTIRGGIDFAAGPTFGTQIGTSTLQQPLTIRDFDSGIGGVTLYDFIIQPPATATSNALNIVNSDYIAIHDSTITDITANNAVRLDDADHTYLDNNTYNDTLGGSAVQVTNDSDSLSLYAGDINEAGAGNGLSISDSDSAYIYIDTITEAGDGHAVNLDNTSGVDYYSSSITESDAGSGFRTVNGSSHINIYYPNIYEHGADNGIVVNGSNNIYVYYPYIEEYDAGSGEVVNNGSSFVTLDGFTIYEHLGGNGINIIDSNNVTTWYGYIEEYDDGSGMDIDNSTAINSFYPYVNESGDGAALRIQNLSDGVMLNSPFLNEYNNGNGIYASDSSNILFQDYGQVNEYNNNNGLNVDNVTNLTVNGLYLYSSNNGDAALIQNSNTIDIDGLNAYSGGTANGATFTNNTGTLTIQNSEFDFYTGYGIYITGQTGDMLLDGLYVYGNGSTGVEVNGSTGSFTLLNSNLASNGWSGAGNGADVTTMGDATLDNVTAQDNNDVGVELDVSGNVSVANSTFIYSYNSAGLLVWAGGSIVVSQSSANYNDADGFALFSNTVVTGIGLTAIGNWDSGIYVNNPPAIPININISSMADNGLYGIDYTTSAGKLQLCADYYSGNPLGDYGAGAGATVIDYMYYPCANPGEVTSGAGGAGGETGVTGPAIVEVPYVADFATETAQPGNSTFDVASGLIFQLIETAEDGAKTLWAQASIPAGAVPADSQATFLQKAEDELPAALPDGSTFVGPAFTLGFGGLTETTGNMQIKMRLPEGFTVPAGQSLAVLVYDSTGTWVTLPTTVADGFATAYTNALGTFVLALVTP